MVKNKFSSGRTYIVIGCTSESIFLIAIRFASHSTMSFINMISFNLHNPPTEFDCFHLPPSEVAADHNGFVSFSNLSDAFYSHFKDE